MAKNQLTPEQDLITRQFYKDVVISGNALVNSPAHKRQLRAIVLELLNYDQLPNGSFVEKGKNITYTFGKEADYSKFPDEWEEDEKRAKEAVANNGDSSSSSSTSQSAKSAKVREAVLPEKV